jgi:hypothetical protein
MYREQRMIEEYATDLASRMGIQLSEISLVEGKAEECLDMHLLHLNAKPNHVCVPIRQQDLEDLQNGSDCTRLDLKLCSALSSLKGGTV